MELPEGESVRLTLESIGPGAAFPAEAKPAAERGRAQAKAPVAAYAVDATGAAIAARAPVQNRLLERVRSLFVSFINNIKTSGFSLFCLALAVYLLTRLIGLAHWPIYYFTDEAMQTNFAVELLKGHFVWQKEFLPTFFNNAGQYEENFSVYVQIIPYLIFGKSVFVSRAVAALISMLGAVGVALILRRVFRMPLWWSGALILSIIPTWFLHSRTVFEMAESIAFYILFIYFYMRYRTDKPWWLLPSLFFGALSAYTYSGGQPAVAVTGGLLLISDLPYHWRHKKVALAGLATLIIVALPYVRFMILHPSGNKDHLAIVGSYLVDNISLLAKFKLFFAEYLKGFDPRYWYLANPPQGVFHDIIRHLMKGYGHLFLWTLPFTVIGILICLWNIRSSNFRTVLITLLAAPAGGAVSEVTITRVLYMVVPSALLTSLGISWVLGLFLRRDGPELPDFLSAARDGVAGWISAPAALRATLAERAGLPGVGAFFRRWKERAAHFASGSLGLARVPFIAIALSLFLVLGSINGYMLWDSVVNGPTWYHDYTLYGMQYGGQQLCSALMTYKEKHPGSNLIVSSSWANGAENIFEYFLPEGFPMRVGTIQEYIQDYIKIDDQDVFVMTPEEYKNALASGRFSDITVIQTLPYPDGTPGFYFTHPVYIANIQDVIAAEKAELAKPVEENLNLGGEIVRVVHSRLDMGSLVNAFDGDSYSVMRSLEDNPLLVEMFFPVSHNFTVFRVHIGGAPTRFTVVLYPADGSDPQTYIAEADRSSDYRDLEIQLPAPVESSHILLKIETIGESAPTHVHVYELQLEGVGWKSGPASPSS